VSIEALNLFHVCQFIITSYFNIIGLIITEIINYNFYKFKLLPRDHSFITFYALRIQINYAINLQIDLKIIFN